MPAFVRPAMATRSGSSRRRMTVSISASEVVLAGDPARFVGDAPDLSDEVAPLDRHASVPGQFGRSTQFPVLLDDRVVGVGDEDAHLGRLGRPVETL